jgi:hypothetical protein
MISFRGTPSGKGGHDEVARRIALNSQCWVERSMLNFASITILAVYG